MTMPPAFRAGQQDLPSHISEKGPLDSDGSYDASSSRRTDNEHVSPFRKLKAKLSSAGSKRQGNTNSSNPSSGQGDVLADTAYQHQPAPPRTADSAPGDDDPYAALRAASPVEGWEATEVLESPTPADPDSVLEQPPMAVPGRRQRLSWHGDTKGTREPSSSRALRSTLSALRLNSWAGDSDYHGEGSQTCTPDLAQLASPTFTVNSFALFPSLAEQTQPPKLTPEESYALLLTFQSTSAESDRSHPSTEQPSTIGHASVAYTANTEQDVNGKPIAEGTEWHELVDPDLVLSLTRDERRRQGVWWEVIRGERAYVRDLGTMIHGFMEQLLNQDPPIITPPERLKAFTMEVFSTLQAIYQAHAALLESLMKRQRDEWPLFGTATDLFLGTMLECSELYEVYMKNYPFAKSRIRREEGRNPDFRAFVHGHTALIHAKRRDIFAFLLRPCHRLTSLQMQLKRILNSTPPDHPDTEELPTLISVMHRAVQSSQPGIASAEQKLALWNVAEKLLLKRGEMVEMGLAEPKRSLMHAGWVWRRMRGESSWHGWQDVHAFLLDNYLLLTRDEEHGRHVVISRPIPLDLLIITSTNGLPERRTDLNVLRRTSEQNGHGQSNGHGTNGTVTSASGSGSDRLMYPFTIDMLGSAAGKQYTLCASSEQARQDWVGKLQESQVLRQIDMESNRMFTVHTISRPKAVKGPICAAETFEWLGREGVAVASGRSVWIGWRRDAGTFRELVRLAIDGIPTISSVTVVPQFGYLLFLCAGRLLAYSLQDLMPSPDPEAWVARNERAGKWLGDVERSVGFVKVGHCKERLLVIYACPSKTALQTYLIAEEPLSPSLSSSRGPTPDIAFRRYATLTIPGHATDITFYAHTLAVATDKQIVIVEPGNPTSTVMPRPLDEQEHGQHVARLIGLGKTRALGMYQVREWEFVLIYDWGACFVNRNGDLTRNGRYTRWNIVPTYCSFRHPSHVLLHDEAGGVVEVRDVMTGALTEVVQYEGLRPIRQSRQDGDMLCLASTGLAQIVETVEL